MITEGEADARMLDNRLRRAEHEGAFLILAAPASRLGAAEATLLTRFDLERRDLGRLFTLIMRQQAASAGADWKTVQRAFNAPPGSGDWKRLMILIDRSIPEIERDLSKSEKTLLLVNAEVLIRYGRIDLLERLRERVWSSRGELGGIWVLTKREETESLFGDGKMLALFRHQLAQIPEEWVTEN